MSVRTSVEGTGAAAAPAHEVDAAHEKIVIVAAHEAMFEGLLQAVRSHFPSYEVVLAERLRPEEMTDPQVRLVLLNLPPDRAALATARECRRRFPAAAVGLISEEIDLEAVCDAIVGEHLVQGWLPISLQLDVWLAVMALLLTGGEYYPVALLQRLRAQREALVAGQPIAPLRPPRRRGKVGGALLTLRERQVLELVSRGYQNRLIASRMALSEHTVKVHVHNLIKKLHVTNRTQAAATWRAGSAELPLAGIGSGGPDSGPFKPAKGA
jgi:DNA-binding NarL/FixJ family response regulator